MRKNFKTLAGMAICILGALAASSCSKDEFFGLEDSEVLDYSTKTEIALSQEYADYAIACFNIAETMLQPADTTGMKLKGDIKGKPVYAKEGTVAPAMEFMDILKKAYPALLKADRIDFEEIQAIALAKNEALKEIASKQAQITKGYCEGLNCEQWIYSIAENYSYANQWAGQSLDVDGWWFYAHVNVFSAVDEVLWRIGESTYSYGCYENGGGLVFGDGSAVSMVGWGETWPTIVNCGSPCAEADFIVAPNVNLSTFEYWSLANSLGSGYSSGGRVHYIFNSEMYYTTFYY